MEIVHPNMNVKLPKPGRKARKMSKDAFLLVFDELENELGEKGEDLEESVHNIFTEGYELPKLKKLFKDIGKVVFDLENVECAVDDVQITKGVPYLIASCGGDWERPILIFLYFDETNTFRGYIPTKGNTFDRFHKIALGNRADDEDVDFLLKDGCVTPEMNARANYNSVFSDRQNFNIIYNIDACKEDFEARIIPV